LKEVEAKVKKKEETREGEDEKNGKMRWGKEEKGRGKEKRLRF
jgi:hypothetical protein